eukprot:Protomagalhaensia_sp_Gyna_25__5061@NODE_56_length_5952_cov_234_277524_g41_i0_p2_GENE_NODE_56_length_5952_cov_234_277524_g41_i0NODE_56_length_5952_cov_234_277524_g41_i0_p2_ORF_typecomplete_len398_score62_74DMT_YdcZ/PF04657_13/2e09DMT_YdcZ/PF04657_13/6_6e17Coiledcoil_56/PF09813_9/0_24_NODE_56_length_5952_cov_234_277524_g41_i01461339
MQPRTVKSLGDKGLSTGEMIATGTAPSKEEENSSSFKSGLTTQKESNRALLYFFPLSVGLLIPVLGGMNTFLQEEVGGNVFCLVAVLYCLASIVTGLWVLFTGKQSISQCYYRIGEFIFPHPSLNIFSLTAGLSGIVQYVILSVVTATGGVSVFALGNLLGSVGTSILLDLTGTCWAIKRDVGISSYLGAAIVAIGSFLHSYKSFVDATGESAGQRVLAIFLAVIAGFLLCFQSCTSMKLGEVMGEFRRSVFFSYASGLVVLLFITPYTSPSSDLSTVFLPRNWWKVVQFLISIYAAVVVALFQYKLNAAVNYCWVIGGQLISSTIIDSLGLIGVEKRPINVFILCGLAVVCVGVGFLTYDKVRQDKLEKLNEAEREADPEQFAKTEATPGVPPYPV